MYIWTLEFEENWNYEPRDEYNNTFGEMTFVARTAEQAVEKGRKYIFAKSRNFKDDETGDLCYVRNCRLIGLERGAEVNG